ncbi:hypothetical protein MHYP_G00065640 [Metynnis hypsauchen]
MDVMRQERKLLERNDNIGLKTLQWKRTELEQRHDLDVTPDLHKPRPGPSHLRDLQGRTIMLPTKTEASVSEKLTKELEDTSADRKKATNHLTTL